MLILTDAEQFLASHLQAVQLGRFSVGLEASFDVLERHERVFLDADSTDYTLGFDLACGIEEFPVEFFTIHDSQGPGKAKAIKGLLGFLLGRGQACAKTLD